MNHLRTIECASGLVAYYDGRVPDYSFMPGPNWVDDGAISLGIASYAFISADKALVYDTHVSIDHAAFIRADLQRRGVKHISVLLSHWHLDHVAGTAAFADCEIISNAKTLAHLKLHRARIEDGRFHGPPAITPLILPTRIFEGEMYLQDKWNVTPSLVLTAGVRYSMLQPPYESAGNQVAPTVNMPSITAIRHRTIRKETSARRPRK